MGAVAGGTIVGLMISIAWANRHYRLAASMGVWLWALLTSLVALTSPRAAALGVVVALSVFGVWFLAYDVWFTGRANAEFAGPVPKKNVTA
jgi:hypothetical protein